jgi:hypothetical protein
VKLGENYRRKSRLVADGHKTDTPTSTIAYLSVVSRGSLRIRENRTDDCGVKRFKYLRVSITLHRVVRRYTVAGPEGRL